MEKVYLVERYGIRVVFVSREAAEEYVECFMSDSTYPAHIETCMLVGE